MYWYLRALGRYGDFSGRSQRAEYWVFTLVNDVISFVLGLLTGAGFSEGVQLSLVIIALAFSLAMFIPSWTVLVRRLHDTGHSGWSMLVALIPVIGAIMLFVWLLKDSDPSDNQYGPSPKNAMESETVTARPRGPVFLVAGLVVVVSVFIAAGFMYVIDRGTQEAKSLAPWPGAEVSAQDVANFDLASLGLQATGKRDARSMYGEGFEDGAVIEYGVRGDLVAVVGAFRYSSESAAASDFSGVEAWAQQKCGRSLTAHSLRAGVVHCDFANSHDMILWSDTWILDIEAAALGDVPPLEVAGKISAAAAKHWQGLDGGL